MGSPPVRTVVRAIVAAGAATIATMLVYASVQQSYRTGANDPQIQIASDAAAAIGAGAPIDRVVPAATVDLASSLAPFVIVYDSADRPIAGSGHLDGALPTPPPGVLAEARRHGSNRVSWMPRRSVRMAAVLVAVRDPSGRVVMAARSLREVEERESRLLVMSALAWGALLFTSVLAAVL
jgi:hypothetical protein